MGGATLGFHRGTGIRPDPLNLFDDLVGMGEGLAGWIVAYRLGDEAADFGGGGALST
jgi:hypothetical protein